MTAVSIRPRPTPPTCAERGALTGAQRQRHLEVLRAREPEAGPIGGADLGGARRRHVHLSLVGVAAAQLAARDPAPGLAGRLDRPRRVLDLHHRAGRDHVERAHAAHRHLDVVEPAGLVAPVLAQLAAGIVAVALHAAGVGEPDPVEALEVGGLPVMRLVGLDAHHLVALARPVDRPVALVPGEADRVVRPEPLGERLVVEPRLAAIGHRRQRQRAGQRDAEQERDPEPGPQREPLQPQEADRQRRDPHAEQQRARAAERDDGRDDRDQQAHQRQEQVAAAARARPAGEQGRRGQQHRPGDLERQLRPDIRPVVRKPHGAERLRAADQPVDQLVPVRRLEVPQLDARHRERADQRQHGNDERPDPAPAPGQPVAREDRSAGRNGAGHPQQGAGGAQPLHHPLPLQRTERRQRGEADEPRRPDRNQCVGTAFAHEADSISRWRSSIRRIFPVRVLGSSSTNSILRG